MSETPKENKTQHLHILMAPSEVEAIDDWGFKNRIRTRGEAIRRLCQMGAVLDAHSDDLKASFLQALASTQDAIEKAKGINLKDQKNLALAVTVGESILSMAQLASIIQRMTALASNFRSDDDLDAAISTALDTEEKYNENRETLRELAKKDITD